MNNKIKVVLLMFSLLFLAGCMEEPTHTKVYNLSLVSNQSGMVEIIQQVNTEIMFSMYGNIILITLGVILIMGFMARTGDIKQSFAVAAYILFVSAMFFRGLELIKDLDMFIYLIVAAVATASLFFNS